MNRSDSGHGRMTGRARAGSRLAVVALVVVLIAAGCQSRVPLGSPANIIGSQVAACAQFQAVPAPPCGPQAMYWAAIQGPYEQHSNGDPYATKCATGLSGAACNVPANPNGASNPDYRASGYTYAIDVSPADIGQPITLQGWDVGQFTRTLTPANTFTPESPANQALRDCNRGVAPFDSSHFGTSNNWDTAFGALNCQTGDSGNRLLNFDVQVFDNDGSDTVVTKDVPLTSCHYRLLTTDAAYGATKNAWTPLCTFTPTKVGIYPFEVRDSGLSGVPDATTMTGFNAFALRLNGATATRLYPVDDASIWINSGTGSRLYLAEITPAHKGKMMYIDLYDVGDGSGISQFSVQVKGPSGGAPSPVPTGAGTIVPAPGTATSCSYNAVRSTTRGPATPDAAANCTVITKAAGSSGGLYNDGWLRLAIQLAPDYACGTAPGTDCWWTLQYDFGPQSFPTDRVVYSVHVG